MKLVVDTNIFISGIFWGGNPLKLLELWRDGQFSLYVTSDILNEYLRVISKIGQNKPELIREWIDYICSNVQIVEKKEKISLSSDPFDDMFLECAVSADVDFIISGDEDLLTLKRISEIPIITISEFLRIVS